MLHKPIIQADASRHLLIMVVSFATSVVATRVYLEATGYPQIGNETFHVAHALWGGLLQLIAALLLLIFVNRWIQTLSAALAGIGIGLFVDEVGKFITQRNDYFFPLAAPIIYVVFLLTLLVYLIVRRQSSTHVRSDMAHILHDLEEVLEDDLSTSERAVMLNRLARITSQTERPDLAELGKHLTAFLTSEVVKVVPDRESVAARLLRSLRQFENRYISRILARRVLVGIYVLNGILTAVTLFVLFAGLSENPNIVPDLLRESMLTQPNITGTISLSWYLVMSILHIGTGLLLLIGLVAFVLRRDATAITLGVIALVITLTFINTLSFYFYQFSVLLNSTYSFVALLGLQRYRDRYLSQTSSPTIGEQRQ